MSDGETIDQLLIRWGASLCKSVSVGGLLSRNAIAHKWKAPLRSLILRETVLWRTHDLLTQAHLLHQGKHLLGSRILIRSALESVAVLVHLNQLTERVLDGKLNFHEFDHKTRRLLLGSRDKTTRHDSINITTVPEHCERKYKGISGIYAQLSECAHPNYEGLCFGYSEIDTDNHETSFSNKWDAMWSDRHEPLVRLISSTCESEYEIWRTQLIALEQWLVENDATLEATKDAA